MVIVGKFVCITVPIHHNRIGQQKEFGFSVGVVNIVHCTPHSYCSFNFIKPKTLFSVFVVELAEA